MNLSETRVDLPLSVVLHLTETCNLRCKMCYYWGDKGAYSSNASKEKPKIMELDLIRDLVNEVKQKKPLYSLFGGEPLMHPQIEDVVIAIKEAGSVIDTPTNGTLLEKHAQMLVDTGFDMVRVSIDGPREINDGQRGKGTFDKAMAGIEAVRKLREKTGSMTPDLQVIFTVTQENYREIETFFLKELDLSIISKATIQMQNFLTRQMGEDYAVMLDELYHIKSDRYWKGMVRPDDEFVDIDPLELARQVNAVVMKFTESGKQVTLHPRVFTPENLSAYLSAEWNKMTERYSMCPVPWFGVDIVANGDVAPCHVFYDLVMGNLHEKSFSEIWNSPEYQSLRSYMKEHKLMPICHGCCILYLAGVQDSS
ncbi:MAG: radical SAM protein [Desulfobacterales bacterium]|nr:radical SAM protein [Desulfobacterales bacterium]